MTEGESSDSVRFFRMDLVGTFSISSSSFLRRAVSSSLNSFLDFSSLSLRRLELELLLVLRLRLLCRLLLRPRLPTLL